MVSSSLPLKSTQSRLRSLFLVFYYWIVDTIRSFTPQSWRFRSIKGQTVLVTGAASGIGQLMSIKFAKLGIGKLVLWDINEDGLKQTVELIKQDSNSLDAAKIFTYKVNLAKREEIYEAGKKVKIDAGPVDILVNNAGIVSGSHILDTPDEKIELTFDINVMAHFYTVKCFLPDMVKQKRGHIVTVASAAGHLAAPKVADYCGSKFANVGFDLSLRLELAQADLDEAIQTTIVKPWLISTGMFSGAEAEIIPYLKPEYVAQSVVNAVLAGDREVVLPRYLNVLFWVFQALPHRAMVAFADLAGANTAMANFQGREPASTKNSNSDQEINNNDFVMNNAKE